jgi:hypothetical protein
MRMLLVFLTPPLLFAQVGGVISGQRPDKW